MGFITSRNKTDSGEILDRDLFISREAQLENQINQDESPKDMIDLGAITLPAVAGMNLGFLGGDNEPVAGVEVVFGKAQMQVSAFAAPRSGGYWEEYLEEVQQGFSEQGFAIFPLPGKYGEALLVRPQDSMEDEELRKTLPMLFWGIEKERSILRIIFRGAAAETEEDRETLLPIIEMIKVNRGSEPKAPGDLLALYPPTGLQRIG